MTDPFASKNSFCPVCGYDLGFLPWKDNSSSDEICPSCGIQFGYDDSARDNIQLREEIYKQWRDKWLKNGPKWYSSRPKPLNFNAKKQLLNISIKNINK